MDYDLVLPSDQIQGRDEGFYDIDLYFLQSVEIGPKLEQTLTELMKQNPEYLFTLAKRRFGVMRINFKRRKNHG